MKRFLLLASISIIFSGMLFGQYRTYKKQYDYSTYEYQEGDRYHPGGVFAASILPGLGQIVAGEPLRGALFMGGWVGSWGLLVGGFYTFTRWSDKCALDGGTEYGSDYCRNTYDPAIGFTMFCVGLVSIPAFRIWSMVDAQRVAKIKNLAWRDGKYNSYNLKIKPYINPSQFSPSNFNFGLMLQLSF